MFYVKLVNHNGEISWADSACAYSRKDMVPTFDLATALDILRAWTRGRMMREVALTRAE